MKRALAFTLMVLAIMIIAVSCEEPHVHSFATEWTYDDTYHWYASTCGHEEVSEKGEHVWKEGGDDNGWITEKAATETEDGSAYRICTVCEYKGTKVLQKLSHVHTYSSYYRSSSKHWKVCTSCGEKFFEESHSSNWVREADGHYKKCYCGYATTNKTAHTFGSETSASDGGTIRTCTVCDYQETLTKQATATTEDKIVVKSNTTTVKDENNNDVKVKETTETVKMTASVVATDTTSANPDENTTTVTFPEGGLKVKTNADGSLQEVSLTITAASASVASLNGSGYQIVKTEEETVDTSQAVIAGFDFNLTGAVAKDLKGTDSSGGDATETKIVTYIAKGLNGPVTNGEVSDITGNELTTCIGIAYNGSTENTGAKIESYNNNSGKLVFTVEHFSKYAIVAKKVVAVDDKDNMYTSLEDVTLDNGNTQKGAISSVADGGTITLLKDAEIKNLSKPVEIRNSLTINLNGKTLNFNVETEDNEENKGAFELPDAETEYSVVIKNGNIKGTKAGKETNTFTVHKNATLTLDNVKMDVTSMRGIQVSPNTESATLTVKDSTIKIKGTYAIATEATVDGQGKTSNKITMSITGSTLETLTGDDDNTGLLINVPGTYTISGSTISGERQGAIIRGGTVTISGSTFKSTAAKTADYDWTESENNDWLDGNEVPLAAIVIGNRSTSYAYPTTVAFSGTNPLTIGESTARKQIYIYKADAASNSDSADRSVTVTGFDENWTVNENFNGAIVKSGTTLLVNDEKTLKATISCVANNETVKLANDIEYTLSDADSDFAVDDKKLWFNGKGVTINFNSKELVVKLNNKDVLHVNACDTGCTFSTNPNAYVADGYVAKKNTDNTWSVIPTSEIESGVTISGIAGYERMLFKSADEAYTTIKAVLGIDKNGELGKSGLTETKFEALFTDKNEKCDARIIWTIYGKQNMDGNTHSDYMGFGRKSSHYGSCHLSRIEFVGGNKDAELTCSGLTFPYERCGEKHKSEISFKNLMFTSSVTMSLTCNDGIIASFKECTFNGSYAFYNNAENELTFTNCKFDGKGKSEDAIKVYGSTTEVTKVQITGCEFKNSRGVDICQATAVATIEDCTFTNCGNLTENSSKNHHSAIKITRGESITINNNTIQNAKGTAIYVRGEKGSPFKGTLTVKNNKISNYTYAFCDKENGEHELYTLNVSGNTITNTTTNKCSVDSTVYENVPNYLGGEK